MFNTYGRCLYRILCRFNETHIDPITSTGLEIIFCQGGIATIFNSTPNESYTKRKPVKNGVY